MLDLIGLVFVLGILCLFVASMMWGLGLFLSRFAVLLSVGTLVALVVVTRGLLLFDTWIFAVAAGWTLYATDKILVRRSYYKSAL
jgi:hypothetical protein